MPFPTSRRKWIEESRLNSLAVELVLSSEDSIALLAPSHYFFLLYAQKPSVLCRSRDEDPADPATTIVMRNSMMDNQRHASSPFLVPICWIAHAKSPPKEPETHMARLLVMILLPVSCRG